MNDISDLIALEAVHSRVSVPNRKALFQQFGHAANQQWGLESRKVVDLLIDREKLISTGFGAGVAIPHARPEGFDRIVGALYHLADPIDFDAVDDMPVDLVFFLLSPPDSGADHLKALARISRLLRDRDFAEKLRGAGSDDALYAMLAGLETRDAA
ncbi:PTS sugar transporter subunit IIA [Stakelama pacifica]|uniref:Phosphotransferase IIA-like nitrogen-regulatory protein PtsN n=1 Tax=Stakelama pacifica TaxID=517720 RepID=A0A4R6FMQ6_9SPHN|nr:PTS sugar transporter subunit IIA [Stakelama pacifica]MAW98664.1 PTS lactose transporter subunit IIC [Sphingomonas sp.]TDN82869.1 phosphotransferase IIA-like nitrogen-regulatory protein PtsN [Stakelama pacifica]GGO95353.1 PTS IIA-like nitrogen-regulatory protein PtsN [Stakelama pacifica]